MIDLIRNIATNILQAFHQSFLSATVISILVLFFVLYLKKFEGYSFKRKLLCSVNELWDSLKKSTKFRRILYVVYCSIVVALKTLLNRGRWENPLVDIVGVWDFYDKNNKFTAEIVENTILFIPLLFFILFFLETTAKANKKFIVVVWRSLYISFIFSFTIEFLQLFLRLGTWQLSDLCFNTLGGLIGGLVYWISTKIRRV